MRSVMILAGVLLCASAGHSAEKAKEPSAIVGKVSVQDFHFTHRTIDSANTSEACKAGGGIRVEVGGGPFCKLPTSPARK